MKKKIALYKSYDVRNPKKWWQFWEPTFIRQKDLVGYIEIEIPTETIIIK